MDIRHNLETASRSSQQPLAFPSNIFRGYMLPSMEGSNPLYFVQLGDERRTLSLLLRITDFIHFMNFFFFFKFILFLFEFHHPLSQYSRLRWVRCLYSQMSCYRCSYFDKSCLSRRVCL